MSVVGVGAAREYDHPMSVQLLGLAKGAGIILYVGHASRSCP